MMIPGQVIEAAGARTTGARAMLCGVDGEGQVVKRELRLRPNPNEFRALFRDAHACGYTGIVLRRLPAWRQS